MKIVRAMKHVSRLQGEIKELKKKISSCLNALKDNEFEESFSKLMDDLNNKTNELVALKTRIMAANIKGNMFSTILDLGELKSRMDFLRELEPKIGVFAESYREGVLTYKSQWTNTEKNTAVRTCQDAINNLIDKLDDFNAMTDI